MLDEYPLFDSHLHIIDKRYPLVPNDGYVPNSFTCSDYLARINSYSLVGGTIISGSFQTFDQNYLIDALKYLGPKFVGVTQLPFSVTDEEILELDRLGVRAIRFNLKRGGSEGIEYLQSFASRVNEVAGWHVELYVDSAYLEDHYRILVGLPSVCIDHLGLSKSGLMTLIRLADLGAKVKATGFGRLDFPAADALKALYQANPESLMFGTDLPSTRAPREYSDEDYLLVVEALGDEAARRVFSENAIKFYRPRFG